MMSDDAALDTALALKKQDLERNVAAEESANLKNSLLFQFNWPDLLQSAPTAINSMGACFIAASSPKAVVEFQKPEKGFQYLRYSSLQANLVETANLGRYAFNEAQVGMGQISQGSDIINGKLKDVLQLLGDPESAKVMLKPQMRAVSNSATTCAASAKKMEGRFQEWLFYACEMHAACVQQEQTAAEQALSNEVCIAAEQTKLTGNQEAADTAKKTVELLGKQVQTTADAFKKASDEYPSGWDIVGQQIVGDLANCATTALKAAIPVLVAKINPVAGAVSQGQDIIGSFVNKGNAPNGAGSGAVPAPMDNNKLRPQSAADPASAEIVKDMTYIELLNAIVNGKDGGIDWEKARGGDDPKKSVAFISSILDDAKKTFAGLKTNSAASTEMTAILETVTSVSSGLLSIVQKNKNIAASWPSKDDPQSKAWVSSFQEQYMAAIKASAKASVNNGGAVTTPIMSNAEPAVSGAKPGDSQAKAILESAKNRLDTTQQAYLATQDNYLKASNVLVEQQNKIAEIQASLTKLTNQNITLAEIKAILIQSIKLIIQLKTQINNLVQFFSAITVIITSVVDLHVQPFLEQVQAITGNGSDPGSKWVIGNYTLTDYMRSNLFSAVLTLRTYFSVFGDIAKMWMRLSIENIQPGMTLCDQVSITSEPKELPAKMNALSAWSKAASDNIKKMTAEKQAEITEGLENRIANIGADTKLLPASQTQKKAIESAKVEQTSEVAKALVVKEKTSSLSRFALLD